MASKLLCRATVAAGVLVALSHAASAGELDRCRTRPTDDAQALRIGGAAGEATIADLDVSRDTYVLADTEFHPVETDRWTPRNNRIRITAWTGAWFFSDELRIHHDVPIGLRINWEVPGFIGIRWDSGVVPWSRMEVKIATPTNGRSSRYMDGFVHSHTLSLGIFNPELSIDGLAFWAGFGVGIWLYNYEEDNVVRGLNVDAEFSDEDDTFDPAGNIFVELDYKVHDIFHVGLGLRQHFLLARHTDDGRFYELNGVDQSVNGRNEGVIDDLAGVTELTINLSVLF